MVRVDVASLGYRTDLAILRAEGGQITDCGDHLVIRTEQNPRYWWGNFILLAAPPGAGELPGWLARFAALFPTARHRTFGVDRTDAASVDYDMFTAAGFRPDRSVVLTATSVRPARRPGLAATIRRLAGADDWRQSAELRRACADSGGSAAVAGHATTTAADLAGEQEFEARKLAARRRLTETGQAAWFGAFDGSRLVAQLGLARAGDGLARYQDVETHPEFRRQGLAGTLICAAARYGADELTAARLVIVADPDYHAIRLYTALGFTPAEDQLGFEKAP